MSPSASSGSRKKSPATRGLSDDAVDDVEVDDDELAAGNLVLTVHGVQPTDRRAARERLRSQQGIGVLG